MIRSYIVEIININKPDFPARVTTKAGHFRQREKKSWNFLLQKRKITVVKKNRFKRTWKFRIDNQNIRDNGTPIRIEIRYRKREKNSFKFLSEIQKITVMKQKLEINKISNSFQQNRDFYGKNRKDIYASEPCQKHEILLINKEIRSRKNSLFEIPATRPEINHFKTKRQVTLSSIKVKI